MNTEQERAAFDAWAEGFGLPPTSLNTVEPWAAWKARAALAATLAPAEPVAWLYTLEYGTSIADRKVSLEQLRYPFGVCGADYLRVNDDGTSYVRETPLRAAAPEAATPAPALYVGLIERLMRLSTRLGIAHEGGVEHFAAGLEDRLYEICRGAEGLLDSMAATPAPARCANGPMGCDYPRCDCNGASTKESNQ